MIAHLRGKLLEKRPNLALVEVGGVGYSLTIPVSTYSRLGDAGEEVALHVYTHVREDALALFGFSMRREKEIFEKLITVAGIGPRLAVTILSGLPPDELLDAIRSGDAVRLTRIPGVGRKIGERLVLELREKLGPLEKAGDQATGAIAAQDPIVNDVISALLNLGCTREAAVRATQKALGNGTAREFEPLFRGAMDLVGR
jgi:Holliday junction DNA helicase RuvA